MAPRVTTMKITVTTRDRLRSCAAAGESLEDVVIKALDAYDAAGFWSRAEAWAAAETAEARAARRESEADWDAVADAWR